MKLKVYKLDFGWEFAVPESWVMEKKELGSYIFYPDNPKDETTIYVSAIYSGTKDRLTPENLMKEAFLKSIPENAQETTVLSNLQCRAFSTLSSEGVYRIGVGYFTDGNLLSLNVFAKGEENARMAAAGFSKVKFNGDKKDGV